MKKIFKQKNTGPAFDVVLKVLELAHEKRPEAKFISSLLMQYRERGGLSKKQLEGLHSKASRIEEMPAQYLATLQAIILKKHTKEKSRVSSVSNKPAEQENEQNISMIHSILELFPSHKMVLLYKAKMESRQALSSAEKEQLKKFHKLLIK